MPRQHTVKKNECLAGIAARYGLLPDTIWKHGANAALREARKSYNVLLEGDELTIPDVQRVHYAKETRLLHRFRKKGVPVKVNLRLLDGEEPRRDVPWLVEVDGEQVSGTTDAEGRIEFWAMPGVNAARLEIDDAEGYALDLGRLDPVTEASGVRQRLINLGYLDADGDDDEYDVAIIAFKRDHCGLEMDYEDLLACDDDEYNQAIALGDDVRASLLAVHGS